MQVASFESPTTCYFANDKLLLARTQYTQNRLTPLPAVPGQKSRGQSAKAQEKAVTAHDTQMVFT